MMNTTTTETETVTFPSKAAKRAEMERLGKKAEKIWGLVEGGKTDGEVAAAAAAYNRMMKRIKVVAFAKVG